MSSKANSKKPSADTPENGTASATLPAEEKAVQAQAYFVWSTDDCPAWAPTVCGIEFPRYVEQRAVDADGKAMTDPVPTITRKTVVLEAAQVQAITEALAAPVQFDARGRLVSGKVVWDEKSNQPVALGPLGKWLKLAPVSDGPQGKGAYFLARQQDLLDQLAELAEELLDAGDDADLREQLQEDYQNLRRALERLEDERDAEAK